jgi:hypothetical protein
MMCSPISVHRGSKRCWRIKKNQKSNQAAWTRTFISRQHGVERSLRLLPASFQNGAMIPSARLKPPRHR